MENAKEIFSNRLDDLEFAQKIREAFMGDLGEEATEPDYAKRALEFTPEIVETIRNGGKI